MKNAFALFIIVIFFSCQNKSSTEPEKLYFNQNPPGNEPELFAPGIVNTGMPTRDITFSPDGKEVFFGVNIGNFTYSTILTAELKDGKWSSPEVATFASNPRFSFLEPCFSPLGDKLFYVSTKQDTFTEGRIPSDIWVIEKNNESWGEPYKLDTVINSKGMEYYPSVANNGNLYFTREVPGQGEFIFRSEFKDGKYQKATKLPEEVNAGAARFNATIAKDESFMIVPAVGISETFGSIDYYISFNDPDKGWSKLLNMGAKMNTKTALQYAATLSSDGKYIFFMSSRTDKESKEMLTFDVLKKMHTEPENGNSNIYWMEAGFIKDLKKDAIFNE